MGKDRIEELFDRLKDEFDIEEPRPQHRQRFLKKLGEQENPGAPGPPKKRHYLKPLIGTAASIAIIMTVFFTVQADGPTRGLASVSSEMAKTQRFYTVTIATEMRKIEKHQDPKILPLIQDAMAQLRKLEAGYAKLQKDLAKSGNDERVVFGMITNFQNRMNVLQNLLKQIKKVKQLKPKEDEEPKII